MKSVNQQIRSKAMKQGWDARKENWILFVKQVYAKKYVFGSLQKAWDSTRMTFGYSEREARMAENYYHKHPELQ